MECKFCRSEMNELCPMNGTFDGKLQVTRYEYYCPDCYSGYTYSKTAGGSQVDSHWYELGENEYLSPDYVDEQTFAVRK